MIHDPIDERGEGAVAFFPVGLTGRSSPEPGKPRDRRQSSDPLFELGLREPALVGVSADHGPDHHVRGGRMPGEEINVRAGARKFARA
jgi:hypothetical protein